MNWKHIAGAFLITIPAGGFALHVGMSETVAGAMVCLPLFIGLVLMRGN